MHIDDCMRALTCLASSSLAIPLHYSQICHLSAQHTSSFACRGQVIRVKAPWVKHFYFTGFNSYILPNVDTVVLGGTTQKNNWDTTASMKVRHRLLVIDTTADDIMLFKIFTLLLKLSFVPC